MMEEESYRTPLLVHQSSGCNGGSHAADCSEFDITISTGVSISNSEEKEVVGTRPLEFSGGCVGKDSQTQAHGRGDSPPMQHVISFFGNSVSLERPPSVDPFRNKTPTVRGLYEWIKTVIFLPILVLRVLATALVLLVGLIATKIALAGWQQKQAPLPRWRRTLMAVTRFCGRCLLFCWGFHWIRRIGKPAPREVAPIVVSNHVSFVDPILYFYEFFPSIVSSKSHESICMVGTIIRAMQVITVDRSSPDSRKIAAVEIERKAACHDFPRVLLFPEGTTTNGRALISFKLGAFVPGFPIQPVVVRYPFVHFDISWGDIPLVNLLFRMLTQVTNFIEVEYLPVISPSPNDQGNPEGFAERVRYEMARALNVPETEHTFGDLMLSVRAQQLKMFPAVNAMVEMGKVERLFHLSTREVKEYLDKFVTMDSTHRKIFCLNLSTWWQPLARHSLLSGNVTLNQFLEALDLPKCVFSEQIFHLFDKSERGYINFWEFVAVLGSISKHTQFSSFIRSAFDACDHQKDGCLSRTELEHSLRLSLPSISSTKVQKWFEKLDTNGDGIIFWEEFRTFVEKNPELLAVFMLPNLG